MSRQVKLFIYGIVFLYAIASNIEVDDYSDSKSPVVSKPSNSSIVGNSNNNDNVKSTIEDDSDRNTVVNYTRPENGFSPYDSFFGKGIYNNSSGNEFVIKNSNSTDAVVLLVNANTGRKTRNEYIRKGNTFTMTGVPNGTYYLEWASGNDWNPNLKVGRLKGGFQTNKSFTKTRDRSDWMNVPGYMQWTVTLYSVPGGDVESENLTANEFGN